jgi:ectoine hydroxylase-related dioxygenase (phytanoyl-CoA dioxygenase family)
VRAQFERDGWTVVRGVVSPPELAAMHDVFMALVPEAPYPPGPDGVLRELTGAATAHPPLAAIARDPRFGALAAEALGAQRIQLLQDSLLYKPARDGGSVEWHQDHAYVGFLVPARVIAIRIALLPEHEGNGGMRVVSGSHRWGPVGENRSLTATSVTSLADELSPEQRAELARAEPLALAPGDVSIHHCLTTHGSAINRSDEPRRTIILRMFDAACRLDATRIPEHARGYFPTDADGGLAPHAFPIVFSAQR